MLIASACRRRILIELTTQESINVMRLVFKSNSTYCQVNQNLAILKREQIIFDMKYGHKRIIRLNRENPKTSVLLKVLGIFNEFEKTNPDKKEKGREGV